MTQRTFLSIAFFLRCYEVCSVVKTGTLFHTSVYLLEAVRDTTLSTTF